MNIIFAAAECAPFVKVGGLADVVSTLPSVLKGFDHDVIIVIPHHGPIDDEEYGIEQVDTFEMPWHGGTAEVQVASTELDGVPVYFLRAWPYFNPAEQFIYHGDEGVDVGRFLFFASAVLHFSKHIDFQPDLFHVHDWHTAMIPFLLRRVHYDDPALNQAAVLFSIHNMKYQGWGVGWHLADAGLPPVDHSLLHVIGKEDNSLAVGLAYSTMLSTVSPQYAREIVDGNAHGLEGLVQARQKHLVGILNGIDVKRWDAATSDVIETNFTADTLEERIENKRALQERLGLPQKDDVPIIATVMRLVDQKGVGILLPAMWHLLYHARVQFVLLGTGFYQHEHEAWRLSDRYRKNTSVTLAFDSNLAEQIYAGADIFVMPSLFEPCGIGQMLAMRYGAVPVVRAVGGLVDTVTPDVGFLFRDFHEYAVRDALSDALHEYYNDKVAWQARQKLAMARDLSWQRSAKRYVELYQETCDLHQAYHGE